MRLETFLLELPDAGVLQTPGLTDELVVDRLVATTHHVGGEPPGVAPTLVGVDLVEPSDGVHKFVDSCRK